MGIHQLLSALLVKGRYSPINYKIKAYKCYVNVIKSGRLLQQQEQCRSPLNLGFWIAPVHSTVEFVS